METKGTLLIVDVSALAFRSHFAFINRPLMRKDGMVTSALYGTANSLVSIIKQIEPTHIDIAVLSSSVFVTANQPLTALWALSYFSIPSITDALTVIRAPPKA